MSRIRTIKPEFFLDDELAELPPLTRLLFIGLWTLADCEGRLEDRPKRIRAQIHPFDDGDTDAMLQDLHDRKFIIRYAAGDLRAIEIRNFKKHQRITGKEAEGQSEIPARTKEDVDGETTGKQRGNNGETTGKQRGNNGETVVAQEGKGREGKGRERIYMAAAVDNSPRAYVATAKPERPAAADLREKIERLPIPLAEILAEYHRILPDCIPCHAPTERLIDQIAHLCAPDTDQLPLLECWSAYFRTVARSPLLCGKSPPREGYKTPFVADLDWLTRFDNFMRVAYENRYQKPVARREAAHVH